MPFRSGLSDGRLAVQWRRVRHGHLQGGGLLKDPRHPPGPAFEQASHLDEHRRQQLVAALTPVQRQGYDQLRQQHEIAGKELREQQEREAPDKIAGHMRDHLLPGKEPHLRPNAHKYQLQNREELAFAAKDFAAGKETRATQKYQHELRNAHGRAEDETAREQGQEREKQRHDQQRERDGFLKQAQHERAQEKTKQDFEKAARDPSWQRAFNRAAQKEVAHERDHTNDHKHDHDKPR